MNLFIFNFKNKILNILVFILCLLFLSEITIRLTWTYLSNDLKHINSIAEIGDSFSSNKFNIIFLGNSLTRRAVDPNIMEDKFLENNIKDININMVYPDDTSVIEWYYIVKKYFSNFNKPNLIAIHFVRNQLVDVKLEFEEIERLAYYNDWSDFYNLIIFEEMSFNQVCHLVLSKISMLYSYRQRIQSRVLDLIPGYRKTAQIINENIKKTNKRDMIKTYKHLENLVGLCKLNNIELVLISHPLPNDYKIDNRLFQKDIKFLDLKNKKKYDSTYFLDNYHLNESGALIHMDYLANSIKNYIIN